jgi:hypothetical protein
MAAPKRFTGHVVKKQWGRGSKSEHMAVALESGNSLLKLRREGGHPFADAELEKLVGRKIEARGELLDGSTLLLSSWQMLD